jgi:hypothetical protein
MNKIEKGMLGVGCFADQPTLTRVLTRLMDSYSLGEWRNAVDRDKKKSVECLTLHRLINGRSGIDAATIRKEGEEKITGFFLGFENQCLNLSIFTRCRGITVRKYKTSLEELSRLRFSRLH